MAGLATASQAAQAFEPELRISWRWAAAITMIFAHVSAFSSQLLNDASISSRLQSLALLLIFAAGAVLAIGDRRPQFSRWLAIAALTAMIALTCLWLDLPEVLTLMVIPVALAQAMIGSLASVATAAGDSVIVGLLWRYGSSGASTATLVITLLAVWTSLAVMYALYRQSYQVGEWTWGHYTYSLGFLEEARDSKARLEQSIIDLAHANRQLALANERIAALRTVAEEARKAKTMFVSKVSHEFRTPLNMIIGLVGLIVERQERHARGVPPQLMRDLRVVYRNCQHLSSMVDDVLNLSQAETGSMPLHRERVDLASIVDSATTVIRPLVEMKKLSLCVDIPADIPKVYCDRTRIRQVVLNLLSNAARFTETGGITVRVVQRDQQVRVTVTDTGPGISPEDAERIFEPFGQGTSQLWHDKGGSGLGLSISRQFVNLHGGRMWLESKLGMGSSFVFELPISPPIEHVTRPGHWIREDWRWRERSFMTGKTHRVDRPVQPRLVVYDAAGDLCSELARLTDEVEFIDARTPDQVVEELQQHPADAVLLNTDLKGDFWSLAEAICREAPRTPLIGCSVPRRAARALEVGAIGYLIKPVTIADLQEAIREVKRPVGRILVVDDDPDVLDLFTRMLHLADDSLEVMAASSGMEALDILHSNPPDLMLLDILMPSMDGWQVMEQKNMNDRTRDIPVILVSAEDPLQRPLTTRMLFATVGDGLFLNQLLRCALELPALLLQPA